jgi:hypothetical protein
VVGGARGEDLRFACEAAEGSGLDDALAIALEGRTLRVRRRGVVAHEERVVAVGDG